MKFKLRKGKGSVSDFTDAQGVKHLPGDIVDLPAMYKGEKWLESLEPERKIVVPPAKVEPVETPPTVVSEAAAAPLSSKKRKKAK